MIILMREMCSLRKLGKNYNFSEIMDCTPPDLCRLGWQRPQEYKLHVLIKFSSEWFHLSAMCQHFQGRKNGGSSQQNVGPQVPSVCYSLTALAVTCPSPQHQTPTQTFKAIWLNLVTESVGMNAVTTVAICGMFPVYQVHRALYIHSLLSLNFTSQVKPTS